MNPSDRYLGTAHALQSAERFTYEQLRRLCPSYPSSDLPMGQFRPHLIRSGLDGLLCEFGAIVDLLLTKGMLTKEEIAEKFEEYYRRDIDRLRAEMAERTGIPVDRIRFA